MKSYRTIQEAREAATPEAIAILEIAPGAPGIGPYVLAKCDTATLRRSLARTPLPEIARVIGTACDLDAERRAARAAQLAERVPGLELLRAAHEDAERYHEACTRMMEDEGNDGARPPRRPTTDPAALAVAYPIAAAYLRAEAYSRASHDVKSAAGLRAMRRLEAGEEAGLVIREMEGEWGAHVTRHVD